MVETKVPDLDDVPLADLADDEDLIAALWHALGTTPRRRTETVILGARFGSSI